jgi:striatin 1/3/4
MVISGYSTLRPVCSLTTEHYNMLTDVFAASPLPLKQILAHPSPITSISYSPRDLYHVFTSSTDCSVRMWDIGRGTSTQELAGHRKRAGEGVTKVLGYDGTTCVALSAGGDGVIKIWSDQ